MVLVAFACELFSSIYFVKNYLDGSAQLVLELNIDKYNMEHKTFSQKVELQFLFLNAVSEKLIANAQNF